MRTVLLWFCVLGCSPSPTGFDPGPEPAIETPEPALRRLTTRQYANTLVDLFGSELILPSSLEPDVTLEGLASLGAATAATSPLGVERYEAGSRLIASQRVAQEGVFTCGSGDSACFESFVRSEGTGLYRRALTSEEVERLTALIAAEEDPMVGAEVALWAMLQSPNFLYRTEVDGVLSPTDLATRMAYFLWNGPPDVELLAAAEDGSLLEPDVRAQQVDRMLADPRYVRGVRDFFSEFLELEGLHGINKDPTVFEHTDPELWRSAEEETLAVIEDSVLRGADYRDLFRTRRTYIDRRLAALYEVPAPSADGFAWTELPADGPRQGLLGHASILGLHAHPTSSSATRRGSFLRTKLLCQFIPPPPADVDTSIPEASNAPTLRDRLVRHREDIACAGCHGAMDPPGLALEQFDGIGRFRTLENQAVIDPSGELDGVEFPDAAGLGDALAVHEELPVCMTERMYAYAVGHLPIEGEEPGLEWLERAFVEQGHSVRALMRTLVLSDAFAQGGDL